MNTAEYENLAQNEVHHWWYQGLRDALAKALLRCPLPERARVLDAGCGTGANLVFFREQLQPSYLGGFDHSIRALELAAERDHGADLYVGDICQPEIRPDRLDLVNSCDVICISGTEKARPGLLQLVEKLEHGGVLILNLPAFDWLLSEHDRAMHTSERFKTRDVRKLLLGLGLEPVLVTYRVCFLFPAIALARFPGIVARWLGRVKPIEKTRSSIGPPPAPLLNETLHRILRLENWLISKGVRFPFGSSVFAVGRKG